MTPDEAERELRATWSAILKLERSRLFGLWLGIAAGGGAVILEHATASATTIALLEQQIPKGNES